MSLNSLLLVHATKFENASYLAVVRYTQIMRRLPDPLEKKIPLLKYMVRWVKRAQVEQGVQQRTCLPIMPQVFRILRLAWVPDLVTELSSGDPSQDDIDGCMLWAAAGEDMCPVVALVQYLVRSGPDVGPLFLFSDGTPLSLQRLRGALCDTDLGKVMPM